MKRVLMIAFHSAGEDRAASEDLRFVSTSPISAGADGVGPSEGLRAQQRRSDEDVPPA